MIQVQQLSKSYQSTSDLHERVSILKNINFEIKKGETVAIVGASGSGKSTLLGLLSGLDQPDQGSIQIDSQSLQQLTGQALTQFRAQNISIVFQQYYLVQHLTAFENVVLPLEILKKTISESAVINLLKEVGLENRLHHKPTQLSGGESQRLALARALITEPKLLLADEPSGSLDSETGQKVMNLFFDRVKAHETTSILVTHDIELAKRCDRILKLTAGQLQQV